MKKLLFTLFFFVAIQVVNAQSFLGVPISGNVSTTIAAFFQSKRI
jgi:hypothetical protein